MVHIASLIKDIIDPIINSTSIYKIELYDDSVHIYDQQRAWVEKRDAIRTTLLNNQRRIVIRTSQSEISNFKNLTHTSFNWFMEVYARRDDEQVMEDLFKIIDELKDKVTIEDGYKIYLTFTTPLPQISEIDNGVWMRSISFGGAGVLSNFATLSDEIKFEIGSVEIDTVLNWSAGISATGDSYQMYNAAEIKTSIENISNGIKMKMIYKASNPIFKTFLSYSLGQITTPAQSLAKPLKIINSGTTINWPNAKMLSVNTENAKGGIVILVVEFIKE